MFSKKLPSTYTCPYTHFKKLARRKILRLSNQTMRYLLPVVEDFLYDLEGKEKTHMKNFCLSSHP